VTPAGWGSEFAFELAVCAWAEREWPPEGSEGPALVARQLGWKTRRWDTIVVEVDPAGLRERLAFGSTELDSDIRHVLLHAPAEWTYYREALPHPGYPWRYVREAIHAAETRDAIRSRKREGRIEIERVRPYPDWVERVIAIENKPDLDASAADRLADQLERDVAAGLADEVWLATATTDSPVEPALLERIPAEVGILALDDARASVLWRPRSLAPDKPGIEILDRPGTGEHDQSAARFDVVSPETKARKRLNVAERALDRGWRSYVDSMRPDCTHFDLRAGRYGTRPHCEAFDRTQTPAECRGACEEFSPEPPADRAHGWPVEGGPGTTVTRVLEDRRERRRQSVSRTSTSDRGTESR
jgi:hypothetical protein